MRGTPGLSAAWIAYAELSVGRAGDGPLLSGEGWDGGRREVEKNEKEEEAKKKKEEMEGQASKKIKTRCKLIR